MSRFLPGLLLALLVGLIGGRRAATVLNVGPLLGTVTLVALASILATTLAPDAGIPDPGTGPGICILVRFVPAPLAELTAITEASLNVILFLPLGLALGLAPRTRSTAIAIGAAVALPFAIETIQYVVPALGRYCDSGDVADNLTGLIAGLAVGLTVGSVIDGAMRHRNRRAGT